MKVVKVATEFKVMWMTETIASQQYMQMHPHTLKDLRVQLKKLTWQARRVLTKSRG